MKVGRGWEKKGGDRHAGKEVDIWTEEDLQGGMTA